MLNTRTVLTSSTLAALALAPSLALAQIEPAPASDPAPASAAPVGDGDGFGSVGQIFLTDDFDLNWTQTTSTPKSTRFRLSPTLFFFLAPNVAVGGTVGLDYLKFDGDDDGTTIFTIGPSAGYNIPLQPALSIFPNVQIAYQSISAGGADAWALPLTINAPVMFHLMPHFSIGLGPFFLADLGAKDGVEKRTQFGIDLLLGGYF